VVTPYFGEPPLRHYLPDVRPLPLAALRSGVAYRHRLAEVDSAAVRGGPDGAPLVLRRSGPPPGAPLALARLALPSGGATGPPLLLTEPAARTARWSAR